jgi:hypothetical protein
MDNMVYVQFNGRIIDKKNKLSYCIDPLLGADASRAQYCICEATYIGEEIDSITGLSYINDEAMGTTKVSEPRRSVRVRELHEVEEFVSNDEYESNHGMNMKTLISSPMMMV